MRCINILEIIKHYTRLSGAFVLHPLSALHLFVSVYRVSHQIGVRDIVSVCEGDKTEKNRREEEERSKTVALYQK